MIFTLGIIASTFLPPIGIVIYHYGQQWHNLKPLSPFLTMAFDCQVVQFSKSPQDSEVRP
jgi:hypothetical protein